MGRPRKNWRASATDTDSAKCNERFFFIFTKHLCQRLVFHGQEYIFQIFTLNAIVIYKSTTFQSNKMNHLTDNNRYSQVTIDYGI